MQNKIAIYGRLYVFAMLATEPKTMYKNGFKYNFCISKH